MLELEFLGRFGQYIKVDLRNLTEQSATVSFPGSQDETTVPLNCLKLIGDTTKDILPGQAAEVLYQFETPKSPASHLNVPSWWPCKVDKVREKMAVIKLDVILPTDASEEEASAFTELTSVTDIVERSTLRPPSNKQELLSSQKIQRHTIAIPEELSEFASDPSVHTEFLRRCGGHASVHFDTKTSNLMVFSTRKDTVVNVGLLQDTHVKMLRQKWAITRSMRNALRNLDLSKGGDSSSAAHPIQTDNNKHSPFQEKFTVPQRLMGLSIGSHGANIRAAREIPGILQVNVIEQPELIRRADCDIPIECLKDVALIIVDGETQDAVSQARSQLEFTDLRLEVPRRFVGRVIGKKLSNIMSTISKSGVINIRFDDAHEELEDMEFPDNRSQVNSGRNSERIQTQHSVRIDDTQLPSHATSADDYAAFIVSGTKEAVERARLLISFQIDHIRDLEKMEAEKNKLMDSLSHVRADGQGGGMPGRGRDQRWVGGDRRGDHGDRRGDHGDRRGDHGDFSQPGNMRRPIGRGQPMRSNTLPPGQSQPFDQQQPMYPQDSSEQSQFRRRPQQQYSRFNGESRGPRRQGRGGRGTGRGSRGGRPWAEPATTRLMEESEACPESSTTESHSSALVSSSRRADDVDTTGNLADDYSTSRPNGCPVLSDSTQQPHSTVTSSVGSPPPGIAAAEPVLRQPLQV